jgi:copper chaperone NosL
MNNAISKSSRLLLVLAAVMLTISIFTPIWRIELDAPQYPEGLMMQIFSYKLGGQVDIINGLNHYIGMQTLHAENFIEFTILPYLISFYVILTLAAAVAGKKKFLYVTFWAFVFFGIVAMIDFWRWEYNYGHNLDPTAAIVVPGMSYQPPLIGFKQLLNFGAFSVPDIGGWLFVGAGILMLFAVLNESKLLIKMIKRNSKSAITVILLSFFCISACNNSQPQPIKINKDKCDYCEMTISDGRFGAEVITKKGRIYKFDDMSCLIRYKKENNAVELSGHYIHDYSKSNTLIDATKAIYVEHKSYKSPMNGNIAAFQNKADAEKQAEKLGVKTKTWNDLLSNNN